jgi:2-polyprenyl-3-methyl-5-hydroxy-6-metoxy-1,4-benzoquinol methylase
VLELIGDVPVDGRSILDIGCGRGGGAENRHRAS